MAAAESKPFRIKLYKPTVVRLPRAANRSLLQSLLHPDPSAEDDEGKVVEAAGPWACPWGRKRLSRSKAGQVTVRSKTTNAVGIDRREMVEAAGVEPASENCP